MQGYHQQPYQQPHMNVGPQLHQGVVQFMNGVYAWMAAGLAVTAAVAWGIAQSPAALNTLFLTPLRWALLIPFFAPMFIMPRLPQMKSGTATGFFLAFAGLMGVSLSYIPVVYQTGTIFSALGTTVGVFVGMAALGFFTKKDLSGVGQFLIMALWGAIFASIINVFFVQDMGMSLVVSGVVALVSAGLTAYYTQSIKQVYLMHGGRGNLAILGALALYISFLNLFLSILRLFGSRD